MEAKLLRKVHFSGWSSSRRTVGNIFLLLVFVLLLMPFWLTFQDILTRLIMSVQWYRVLQNFIVPYELRIVAAILHLLGFPIQSGQAYIQWGKSGGGKEVIYLAWNCIGWQTLVLFVITLFTGLSGKHTISSKVETFLIGVLGTYLMNVFRISLVIVVYLLTGRIFGTVFHDYFSNIFSLCWLMFFWWFSYSFVLVDREESEGVE